VLRWAVSRGMTATFHWHNDRPVITCSTCWRASTPRLHRKTALVRRASQRRIAGNSQALEGNGGGLARAERVLFPRRGLPRQRGAEAARLVPPLASALRLKLPVGGGTDAHRVMARTPSSRCNGCSTAKPFPASPCARRRNCRADRSAAPLYSRQRLVSFEENARGALAVGQLADLAVLSRDYLGVPIEKIGGTISLLTMVGGRIVYADGPTRCLKKSRAERASRWS